MLGVAAKPRHDDTRFDPDDELDEELDEELELEPDVEVPEAPGVGLEPLLG